MKKLITILFLLTLTACGPAGCSPSVKIDSEEMIPLKRIAGTASFDVWLLITDTGDFLIARDNSQGGISIVRKN